MSIENRALTLDDLETEIYRVAGLVFGQTYIRQLADASHQICVERILHLQFLRCIAVAMMRDTALCQLGSQIDHSVAALGLPKLKQLTASA